MIFDFINCTYFYSPGAIWIPTTLLNGLPWLNKVSYVLSDPDVLYFRRNDLPNFDI